MNIAVGKLVSRSVCRGLLQFRQFRRRIDIGEYLRRIAKINFYQCMPVKPVLQFAFAALQESVQISLQIGLHGCEYRMQALAVESYGNVGAASE